MYDGGFCAGSFTVKCGAVLDVSRFSAESLYEGEPIDSECNSHSGCRSTYVPFLLGFSYFLLIIVLASDVAFSYVTFLDSSAI